MAAMLTVAVPFAMALLAALLGRVWRPAAPLAAAVAPLCVLWTAFTLTPTVSGEAAAEPWTSAIAASGSIDWFRIGGTVVPLGWAVDSLTVLMLLVVGVVALCVVVFSTGYLADEPAWGRYFGLIAAFTGSMSLLVIGDSLVTLFVGWELVGACSYLLIGFWYTRPSAAGAAVKAFITTRVGDIGLLLGIAVLWSATGSVSYEQVVKALDVVDPAVLAVAAVCLAIGAMGKSAQFPLHAWLPDAMEGPTPVSALIHAATMVAAGVFLGARLWPVFEIAPAAGMLLLTAGVVSALGGALAATVQRDIKKVLAYSTISQLGFMFAALGVGAWEAAFFHLMAHAGFKALLFMSSGSVIHGSGTQDIHDMGGLRSAMPWTFAVWMVGVLALAGIAPFSGFFSKDAVIEAVWHANAIAGGALFLSSALTGFYVARTTRLVFFGDGAPGLHPHESTPSMLAPLYVLAIPAAGFGLMHGSVSRLLGSEAEPLAIGISAVTLLFVASGIAVGWTASAGPAGDRAMRRRLGVIGDAAAAAFWWDAVVDRVVVRPVISASRALWAVGDRLIANGSVEGLAGATRAFGGRLRRLQSGDTQSYAIAMTAAIAFLLAVASWMGR